MNKEELYKYAAISATHHHPHGSDADYIKGKYWDPLEDDHDAFDLMVRCQMSIGHYINDDSHDWTFVVSADSRWYDGDQSTIESFNNDWNISGVKSSFREGIVQVAYKIGKHYVEKGYYKE